MHRFLVEKVKGETALLRDADQRHHIRDVLRLKVKDKVVVFDGAGREYQGVITAIDKKHVEFKVTPMKKQRSSGVSLTIACAIPKGGRLDDVIDSLTQLGVERIIPMRTERAVVKIEDSKMAARLRRWEKIAQSAARQCQRSSVPVISPVTDIARVIADSQDFDLKLIPHLAGKRTLIKDAITEKTPKNIIVLIGPEGDFTTSEIKLALHSGFIPVSLGDTTLRVATAAVAVTAYIRLALDE